MKQLTETLYAVEVPIDASFFTVVGEILSYDPNVMAQHGTWEHCNLGNRFKPIGTVATELIDFDVEPYVEKYMEGFIDYENESYWLLNANRSFRSLLSKHNIIPTETTKILILEKL